MRKTSTLLQKIDMKEEVTTFADLCPAAQFSILVTLLLIIAISFSNVILITTLRLVKKHHTPYGDVILAVAVVDLFIGVIVCPLNVVVAFPGTKVRSDMVSCAVIYYIIYSSSQLAFDFQTGLCVERCLLIWKPIWCRKHVTRRTVLVAVVSVLAFRLACGSFALGYSVHIRSNSNVGWSEEECILWIDIEPIWFKVVMFLLFIAEVISSFGLCVAVFVITWAHLDLNLFQPQAISTRDGDRKQTNAKSVFNLSLMFVFLALWLPTLVTEGIRAFGGASDISETLFDVIRIIRYANSALNAPIYAVGRQEFRNAFRHLLTSPPWRWHTLAKNLEMQTSLNIRSMMHFSWLPRSKMENIHFYSGSSPSSERSRRISALEASPLATASSIATASSTLTSSNGELFETLTPNPTKTSGNSHRSSVREERTSVHGAMSESVLGFLGGLRTSLSMESLEVFDEKQSTRSLDRVSRISFPKDRVSRRISSSSTDSV